MSGESSSFDKQSLIDAGLLKSSEETPASYGDGPKTKYQIEKDNEPTPVDSQYVQTLLDHSSTFRSRTAIPMPLMFDLHEEVYETLLELLDCYKTMEGCFGTEDEECEARLRDVMNAITKVGEYIGRDCSAMKPSEFSTNKIYADAKAGVIHNYDVLEEAEESDSLLGNKEAEEAV